MGNEGDSGNKVNLDGDFTVTVDAGSVAAAHLNTINAKTTGLVTATAVTALTGTAAQINTFVGNEGDSGDKVNLDTDYTATISDTSIAASVLNTLNSNVPGLITATSVTNITGTAAAINTLMGNEGDSGNKVNLDGDFTVTVDAGSVAAAHLNTINAKTTGLVTATAATTITGTAAVIATLIGNEGDSGDKVDLASNVAVTVDSGSVAASDLNTINSGTTGLVTATAATTITGSAAEIGTLITNEGDSGDKINLDTDWNLNLDSGTASVSQANLAAAATTGVATGQITETDAATLATLTETTNAYTITVGDSTVTAANLNTIDGATTVQVTASAVTAITGSAADVNTAVSSDGISGLGDESVTLTDTTVSSTVLTTLDSNTSGTIDASTVTTFTGSSAML